MTDRVTIDDDVVEKDRLLQLKKERHDLKFELGQLRLRLDEDEMKIKKLEDDLKNAKKTAISLMMSNEISLQVLNHMVDDVKKLKEEKK
jgi:hypothetical protein